MEATEYEDLSEMSERAQGNRESPLGILTDGFEGRLRECSEAVYVRGTPKARRECPADASG